MGAVQPPDPSPMAQPSGTSFTISGGATAPVAEPGYTTTEFWVSLLVIVIGLLTSTGVIHPSTDTVNGLISLVTLGAPAIIYPLARGIRKSGTTA